jgi:hypothetical protein
MRFHNCLALSSLSKLTLLVPYTAVRNIESMLESSIAAVTIESKSNGLDSFGIEIAVVSPEPLPSLLILAFFLPD